jgi:predicted membrane channel-forming protein YqfA (hemolysin III family)
MNSDLILVIGVVLAIFSIPAIISALSDRRPPRVAALVLIAAGCLVVWALQKKPSGYSLTDVPHAFVRVVGQFAR